MSWVAAGVVGGGMIIKGVQAYSANRKAEKAQKEQDELMRNRPLYEIPSQYGENQKLSKSIMDMYEPGTKSSILAGQGYMQNQVDANSANTLATAQRNGVSSPSQYSSILSSALQSQNDAQTKMGIEGANKRMEYQDRYSDANKGLQDANTAMADQEQMKWEQNTFSPFASKLNATREKIKYNQQRTQERTDSAIESGVNAGTIVASSKIARDGSGAESRRQRRFDRKVDRQNAKLGIE